MTPDCTIPREVTGAMFAFMVIGIAGGSFLTWMGCRAAWPLEKSMTESEKRKFGNAKQTAALLVAVAMIALVGGAIIGHFW